MILTMLWVVSKLVAGEPGWARGTLAAQLLLEKVPLQHEPNFFRINWLQFCPCCIEFCVLNSISLCLALSSLWYLNLRVELREETVFAWMIMGIHHDICQGPNWIGMLITETAADFMRNFTSKGKNHWNWGNWCEQIVMLWFDW